MEIDYKSKEISILKNETEFLKDFGKEYMKIAKHEEILSSQLKSKEVEFENNCTIKTTKFGEEKNIYYEFLVENLKKSI